MEQAVVWDDIGEERPRMIQEIAARCLEAEKTPRIPPAHRGDEGEHPIYEDE